MKKQITLYILFLVTILATSHAFAGNKDRAGQAGATELLMNPWARSAGFHSMNSAAVKGIEALRLNPAGLAFINKTQVTLSSSRWLEGSGVNMNALGLGFRLGESSVLGINLVSVSFGDILVATVEQPDGGSGATFRPQLTNIAVSYAQSFSNSIHVGFLGRIINESIADASASGIALDMGIQYVTGENDNARFGISLRNVGTPMSFSGDGLSLSLVSSGGYSYTVDQRTDKFELPTSLNIGGAYDFLLSEQHRVTVVANFTSNSFTKDFLGGGVEYAFNEMFMIRAGYRYEEGAFGELSLEERSNAYTGLAAGLSIEVPIQKDGAKVGIDYSYRHSNPWKGTHSLGVVLNL